MEKAFVSCMAAPYDSAKEPPSEKEITRRAFVAGLAAIVGVGTVGSAGYLLFVEPKRREERRYAAAHQAIEGDYLLNRNGYRAVISEMKLTKSKNTAFTTPYATILLKKDGEPASAMLCVRGDQHDFTLVWESGRMYTIGFRQDDRIEKVCYPSPRTFDEAEIYTDPADGKPYSMAPESAMKPRFEHAQGITAKFLSEVGKPSALAARVQKILKDAK